MSVLPKETYETIATNITTARDNLISSVSVFYDNVENYIENPSYTRCYGMYEWNYIMYKNNFYFISDYYSNLLNFIIFRNSLF